MLKVVGQVLGVVIVGIGLISALTGLYQFLYVAPKTSIETPGVGTFFSLRVENNSYVHFFSVKSNCDYRSVNLDTPSQQFNFSNVQIEGFPNQSTDFIAAGKSGIAACGSILTGPGKLTDGDLKFNLHFWTRCLPFLPICPHSFTYHFQCSASENGPHCIEGDNFEGGRQ